MQADLGGCFADQEAGRALTVGCCRAFDSGSIPRHRIAAVKPFCSEMAGRVADRCVQLLGGEPGARRRGRRPRRDVQRP
ncbi:acyl-CoA dehydrogenase family protein [Streptomyces sp. NPDC058439]|uniref:acyl-CoA dehydrogenase family protein n=1 Tax=Streptomyces sp. NPDC058439 TaxID=3346500 RepID=UPI0036643CCF